MPKRIETTELDAIIAAVGEYPEGASTDQVASKLSVALNRRTLQRRLAALVKDEKIRSSGTGAQTRYHSATHPVIATESPAIADDSKPTSNKVNLSIDVSKSGELIFRRVTQPTQKRKPVGYNRKLLDDYLPNQTFYLPATLRKKLVKLGTVGKTLQPAGTYARQILNRLLIDLSFHSSRLEGNTYSLLDTKRLIETGKSATGKDAEETQMIMNHKAAIEFLVQSADTTGVDRRTVLSLHALLSDNLLDDPGASGRLRNIPVDIGGSVYKPLAVPQLIEECFNQIVNVAAAIDDPFEQSFFLSVHLPYLQPFEDVNKRVSRLSANIPLIRSNLKPLSFIDVSKDDYVAGLLGVYELNRVDLLRDLYAWAYERAAEHYTAVRQSLGAPDEFKLRYRSEIKAVVGEVITNLVKASDVNRFVNDWAKSNVEPIDAPKFTAVVESELIALHEGNVARYPVTPNQFEAWRALQV
jgi:Fic family protein